MKILFTAWLLVNGAWTHGSLYYGWAPLNTGSEAACQRAYEYALENSTSDTLRFTCESMEDTMKYVRDLER